VDRDGQQQSGQLPAGNEPGQPIVLSEAVADRVGELLAASQEAARVIAEKAEADAEALKRAATQTAVAQAQQQLATRDDPAVPQLKANIAELRELVDELRSDVERLTSEMAVLNEAPARALPPPERPDLDRRPLLIAFNMATNGATRAECERYLADNLDMSDTGELLDAVYGHIAAERGRTAH
jgi:hypothetical protein